MKKILGLLSLSLLYYFHATAQHTHHETMEMPGDSMQMTSSFSLHLPMERDGSGTSWQPDETPMMAHMYMKGNTSLMVHGAVFIRYTAQDITDQGSRGDEKFDAPNWLMFMLSQKLSEKDLLSFHSMFSLDPLTEGKRGYPLLFQTGETANGEPLVDRQHPHDLFAALALNYTHSISKKMDVNAYFGYPGEPALGPPVFMHRTSAMNNPDAPLGHHWQDASHITFGVFTFGFRYKNVKAEGSIFTGREPNENRYDFATPRFDSYSYRLSANPTDRFALQFSQGFIKSPEVLEPNTNVIRTTASILHTKKITPNTFMASALVWGMNDKSEGHTLNSILIESNLKLVPITLYGRYEWVQKDAHELYLHEFSDEQIFDVNAFTIGVNRMLFAVAHNEFSLGVQGTINLTDHLLKAIYGSVPLSGQVYLRLAPGSHAPHHSHQD